MKALETEVRWFEEARRTVSLLTDGSQEGAVLALSDAILTRLEGDVLPWAESALQELSATPEPLKTGTLKVVDNSECPSVRNAVGRLIDALAPHFEHPLRNSNPLVLIAMFLALILQLIGGVSRDICNFALGALKIFTDAALRSGGPPTEMEETIAKNIPSDIRTVRRLFNLDPDVRELAACPTCSMTYEPKYSREFPSIPLYPRRCSYKPWPTSQPCNARLTKPGVKDGRSIRVPIRPFPVQDFDSFVGRMLSYPGVEESIRKTVSMSRSGVLRDISQGEGVREVYARWQAEARALNDDDILLLWSLSVDWFNPYLNKISGKSVSCGSIAMICLLLPPSLRIKPAFVYLTGIIPHPEPPEDQINHFLRPVINSLAVTWKQGVWYSCTSQRPRGRRVYSGLVTNVNDLPGSRKVSGHGGHSHNRFCALCKLAKTDINNLEVGTWQINTRQELYEQAVAWRDAPSRAARKKLYKKTGVRWSELWRLPYWDPTKFVIIDGMHTIYLRIVQNQCRVVLGLDAVTEEQDANGAPEPDIDASAERQLHRLDDRLANPCTARELGRFNKVVLWEACRRRGIKLAVASYRKAKKQTLSEALLVSFRVSRSLNVLTVYRNMRNRRK